MAGFTAWQADLLQRERKECGADPVAVARQLAEALEARGESALLQTSANEIGVEHGQAEEMPPDVAVVAWPVWQAVKAGLIAIAKDNAKLADGALPGYRELQAKCEKAEAAARRWKKRFRICLIALAVVLSPVLFGLMYWMAGVIAG